MQFFLSKWSKLSNVKWFLKQMSNTYFTACSNGEYGGNCIHKCSENCGNGEVCDKVHGHCASCEPGFQGLQCDESKNSKLYIFPTSFARI